MIDGKAIEDTVYAWATNVTGIVFQFASQPQNALRPDKPYGTIQLTDFEQMELKEVSYKPAVDPLLVTEEVRIRPTGIVSINIYGEESKTAMFELMASQWQAFTRQFFQENGVGLVEFSIIRNLPQLVETNWETRMQTDVTFNLIGDYTSDIDTIGEIVYTNETSGEVITVTEP